MLWEVWKFVELVSRERSFLFPFFAAAVCGLLVSRISVISLDGSSSPNAPTPKVVLFAHIGKHNNLFPTNLFSFLSLIHGDRLISSQPTSWKYLHYVLLLLLLIGRSYLSCITFYAHSHTHYLQHARYTHHYKIYMFFLYSFYLIRLLQVDSPLTTF